jgi:hypothetical protein
MSFLSISPREKRLIRIAALVLIPSLGYVYGVKPYFASLNAMQDQVVTERATLARERALVLEQARNPNEARDAKLAVMKTAPMLFEGRDDVIASSELAAYVTRIAERARVNLQQAATRPTILSTAGVRMLRIEIRGESDLQGILSLLNALETGEKLIRFDKLDISHSPGRVTDEEGYETLSIAATVSGFALGDAPADTTRRTATIAGQRGGK